MTAVWKGGALGVWVYLTESEAVTPHPFFSRTAEAGSLHLTRLLRSSVSQYLCPQGCTVQRTPPAHLAGLETGECPSATNALGSQVKGIGWMV